MSSPETFAQVRNESTIKNNLQHGQTPTLAFWELYSPDTDSRLALEREEALQSDDSGPDTPGWLP